MLLISYDISNDKVRTKFAKYLSKFGFRLQYSVFEITNSDTVLANIENEIKNVYMKAFTEEDSVIIFNLSASCKKTCYGYAKNEEKDVEIAKAQETESVETSKVEEKEVVKVASRGSYIRDTSTPPTEYKSVMQVKATAYCLCKKCCGKSPDNPRYGYTASGLRIVPGTGMKVIAVDTSVVPLGTNVYVEGLYGAGNYGYAVAADTGSAIKNMKIDLYMDTHEQALSWGVKTVNLYILDK